MAHLDPLNGKLVVLVGGGGFLGSHVAQALLGRGARVRIADRHPEKAFRLKPLANLGQLQFARCDATRPASIRAVMQGADAAVYLTGTFGANQRVLHADAAGIAAEAAAGQARSFVYVSAIGADPEAESMYASTKGLGEQKVLQAFPQATVMRPSVLFGEEDSFINMFAGLVASFRVLPIFGSDARLQPIWVDDAARAVVEALADPDQHGGKTYEIAGPEVITMEDLHQRIAQGQERRRSFVKVPDALAAVFAALPGTPMSSDQWTMLKQGNVASGELPGCRELGISPKPLSLFLDRWMVRYRKHGRFTEAEREIA